MNKTVKELALELHVAKSTVSKAIHDLNISPTKIGNRFVLSEKQVICLKKHISKSDESNEQPTLESNESDEQSTLGSNESDESNESNEKLISALTAQLETKDEQIKILQAQLLAKDEQLGQLTAALENTTAALTAAQALHAGTLQKQLTMQDEKPKGLLGWIFRKKKKENNDGEIQVD